MGNEKFVYILDSTLTSLNLKIIHFYAASDGVSILFSICPFSRQRPFLHESVYHFQCRKCGQINLTKVK